MTPIELNLDGVEAWSGAGTLPPGQHVCKIEEATEGTSSGGNPQVELLLRATGGDTAGASIRDWIIVIPSTLGKVRQFLEAARCAIPQGDFAFPTGQLTGRSVLVTVREEEYGGKTRARVVAYEPATDFAGNGGDPQPALAASGPAHRDDDIPF